MTKFPNNWKNPVLVHFGPIFPILGAKKFFQDNLPLSHTTSHTILAPCQNLEKIYDTIPRKCPERQKDGRTGRPYFIGSFPLPLGSNKQSLCHYSYHYWIWVLNIPQILNMSHFWIWHILTQHSEYTRVCPDRVLNISQVLNMPGFWIYMSYTGFQVNPNMAEYVWIGREHA